MKTKMHTQNRITKFTNSSFKSLIMLALVFISFGMYGQIPMPWGNSDYTVTGGTDDYGGFIGTLIQANNDGSNNPEENIYFRVGLTSGNRWFYYPQMVVARKNIYLNVPVQLTEPLESKSYISASGSLFSETGNVVSKNGSVFALEGKVSGKTIEATDSIYSNGIINSNGSIYSQLGNIIAYQGDIESKVGNINAFSGIVTGKKVQANDYVYSKGYITAENGLYANDYGVTAEKGNIVAKAGFINSNQGFQTTGYLYAAGKVFLGGNFDSAGTPANPTSFYANKPILSKYSVFVQKGILSEDYAIAPKETWADYVFTKGHVLKPLKEIELYIQENGNLPNIPSATQIAKEGYNLHEMNVKFLEKIEELTLYTIAQQKSIDEQHLAIVRLEQQVQELLSVAKK